jgi:hypothetical protein
MDRKSSLTRSAVPFSQLAIVGESDGGIGSG